MLFNKPPKGSLILILDIQSSIVRASLVYLSDKAKPRIVYTYSKNITHRAGGGSSRIIHATLQTLKEIMGGVYHFMQMTPHPKDFPNKVSEVHFALSSPWVISQAKTLTHSFEHSIEVTEKLIFEIIARERGALIPESEVGSSHLDIIEEKIFTVRLNGYPVQDWKNKKTKELEISFAVSVAGSNTDDLFRDACTLVPKNKIFFHSSLLLQFIALQQMMPSHSSYTLVHVHGELTDVAVVHHHSCTFFGSFPLGVFGVVRQIARTAGTDIEVADSAISLFSQKSYDMTRPQKNITAVEEASAAWGTEFKKMFATITPPVGLPARTIVCAHAHEDFFAQSLKKTYPQVEPELLSIEQLKPFVEYGVPEESVRLSGLYAMALHGMLQGNVI